MKTTNKCKICEVTYKLPQDPNETRKEICFTCEFAIQMIQSMYGAIMARRSIQSTVSFGDYIKRIIKRSVQGLN